MIRDTYVPFPEDGVPHIKLPEVPEDDVHGCFDELISLLDKCKYNKNKDKIVLVGDLVNKGPKSLEVLRYVKDSEIIAIKGNHDDYIVKNFYSTQPKDLSCWYKDLTEEDAKFLLHLPFTVSIPQFNVVVVHAGLVPEIPAEKQHHGTMYRIRNIIETINEDGVKTFQACERDGVGKPWAEVWPGPEHVIFGHDAIRALQKYPFATGIDTGCVYGKELTACILPGHHLISIQAQAVYSAPGSI